VALVSTRDERKRRGRLLRGACPRSNHAIWNGRDDSTDPLAVIEASDAGLVPGLLPVRYGRMAQSPFAFFRGTASLQAFDLRDSPISGTIVQLGGDCHVMNFGGFATPERRLVFDIVDFDESFPGPWEWDVKRLAASLVLAARHRGLSEAVACEAVCAAVASYRSRTAEYANFSALEVWYAQIGLAELGASFGQDASAAGSLHDAATVERGRGRIDDKPPLVYHFRDCAPAWAGLVHAFFGRYRQSISTERRQLFDRFAFEDLAVKIVGVGSVGTRCTVALFLSDDADPLFLQVKEARRSVLEPRESRSRFAHQGERVAIGQRLMQAAGDIFLGWAEVPGSRDYYVRRLHDVKISILLETLGARALLEYGVACGWALARAHAKAGDAPAISGYLGASDRFDRAVAQYAAAYADQVERDYETFARAIDSGRIAAERGEFAPVEFTP
jgi:uncharacterized protein (DUF2252 family)